MSIILILSAVCSAVLSVILYGTIFILPISTDYPEDVQINLFCAQAFAILTIIFAVCAVLLITKILDKRKTKKTLLVCVPVVAVGCVLTIVYGLLTCYNDYDPEELLENDKPYAQSFYPYHDITDAKKWNTELFVSHIPGTDYIRVYKNGTSIYEKTLEYKVEYFKSVSPFLMSKFRLFRSLPFPYDSMDFDVLAQGETMVVDGIELTVFVDENNYAVLIEQFDQAVYASLLNAPADDISVRNFAREIIGQMALLEQANKDRVFLDA